tara:strand:- start:905 stop:1168 length:264 start_codon:yes stop_codon:yes gene_type:complete
MPVGHEFNVSDDLPPVSRVISARCQVDARCIGEGITLLLQTAELGILVDALLLLIGSLHVLADPTPELAAAAARTTAELNAVWVPRL